VSDPSKEQPAAAKPSRRRRSTGAEAIGGVIAGFDYQVFRATKPPAEMVEAARPVRGLTGEDGPRLTIDFPDDAPPAEPGPSEPPPTDP
jgi:hypothetical protein